MATYVVFRGIFTPSGEELENADGFSAYDYLPAYDPDRAFPSAAVARAWLDSNHKGPDVDGYTARFTVLTTDD